MQLFFILIIIVLYPQKGDRQPRQLRGLHPDLIGIGTSVKELQYAALFYFTLEPPFGFLPHGLE